PLRILDLANALIRLSGKSQSEVEIRFTGLREGEKLEEELFSVDEITAPTSCDRIRRTRGAARNWAELTRQIEELRSSLCINGDSPVRAKIKQLVPEYQIPDHSQSHPLEQKWAAAAMASD